MLTTQTDRDPTEQGWQSPRAFFLWMVFGGPRKILTPTRHQLCQGTTLLGRTQHANERTIVCAHDDRMSRVHASLCVSKDGTAKLWDGESKNGTFLNGIEVPTKPGEAVLVRDGDVLRTGGTLWVVRYEPVMFSDAEVPRFVGHSQAAAQVRVALKTYAPAATPVLIQSETGTGKEVASACLHELSGRTGAFIRVNCTAVVENLFEGEFFGVEKGAFTGAPEGGRNGHFLEAHLGTLLLDEIGDMPLPLQAKLLRVLEDSALRRVGGNRMIPFSTRILAATNRNLRDEIRAGRFREDLFMRLSQLELRLPLLRERREDILALLAHLVKKAADLITVEVAQELLQYPWPGHVRELRALGEKIQVIGKVEPALIERLRADRMAASLPPSTPEAVSASAPKRLPYGSAAPSREQLVAILEQTNGNISATSERLGCSRRQLHRWMEKWQLDRTQFLNSK